MSLSLEIFQQNDLLKNSIKYGNVLLDEKNYFMFRKVDLGEFFQERRHICEGNKKVEEWWMMNDDTVIL